MMWPGSVFEYQGTSPTFRQVCIGLTYEMVYLDPNIIFDYIDKNILGF